MVMGYVFRMSTILAPAAWYPTGHVHPMIGGIKAPAVPYEVSHCSDRDKPFGAFRDDIQQSCNLPASKLICSDIGKIVKNKETK